MYRSYSYQGLPSTTDEIAASHDNDVNVFKRQERSSVVKYSKKKSLRKTTSCPVTNNKRSRMLQNANYSTTTTTEQPQPRTEQPRTEQPQPSRQRQQKLQQPRIEQLRAEQVPHQRESSDGGSNNFVMRRQFSNSEGNIANMIYNDSIVFQSCSNISERFEPSTTPSVWKRCLSVCLSHCFCYTCMFATLYHCIWEDDDVGYQTQGLGALVQNEGSCSANMAKGCLLCACLPCFPCIAARHFCNWLSDGAIHIKCWSSITFNSSKNETIDLLAPLPSSEV